MPGPLSSIFAAVNAVIPAPTKTFVGASYILQGGAPPRVVWSPANEDYTGPQGVGGNSPDLTSAPPIATRLANVEVHIWGASLDATETLIAQVIQALQSAVVGGFGLIGGQWVTAGDSATAAGMAYVLTVQFRIPVTRVAEVWAPFTSTPTTAEMDFLDGTTYSTPVTTG